MNEELAKSVKKLKPKKLDVLEISGEAWAGFGFKSYEHVDYPDFDICKQTLDKQYDLIIAEQVFEHIPDPLSAAKNVHSMLREGGVFLISTPFLIHYHPSPLDLWRWTKEGMATFLAGVGFRNVNAQAWGNKQCVVASFDNWDYYDKKAHSLENDPNYPIVVWALAQK